MASLERRRGSRFWQIRYRDPVTGKRRREPTRFRWNDRMQTRIARELCARKTFEEKQSPSATNRDRWEAWVRPYLEQRYGNSPLTLSRYLVSWKTLESFLLERRIESAARMNHQAVMDYVQWRRSARKGGKRAKKLPIAPTTIVTEMKVLRLVIDEAIRRGWATVNPCLRLGLSRAKTREKPEITLEEEVQIREALEKAPAWMRVSFEIAMAQGCRFSETRLPLSNIDTARRTIIFHGKGGKVFQTALNPNLVAFLQSKTVKEAGGEKLTWDLPAHELQQCGRNWTRFFRKQTLPHLCFHCTRVTAITRAHRMEVSYPLAMAFFGHSSSLVHSIYTRLGVQDVSPVAEALASYASTQCNRSNGTQGSAQARRARRRGLFGRHR